MAIVMFPPTGSACAPYHTSPLCQGLHTARRAEVVVILYPRTPHPSARVYKVHKRQEWRLN